MPNNVYTKKRSQRYLGEHEKINVEKNSTLPSVNKTNEKINDSINSALIMSFQKKLSDHVEILKTRHSIIQADNIL